MKLKEILSDQLSDKFCFEPCIGIEALFYHTICVILRCLNNYYIRNNILYLYSSTHMNTKQQVVVTFFFMISLKISQVWSMNVCHIIITWFCRRPCDMELVCVWIWSYGCPWVMIDVHRKTNVTTLTHSSLNH